MLGVDRTTVGRWESGRITPQPPQRQDLANALEVSLAGLDALLTPPRAARREATGQQSNDHPGAGDPDAMIRRDFLRILTVGGALTALSPDEAEALADGVRRGAPSDFTRMNNHLWQVYQLARSKGSVYPVVRDQLSSLSEALSGARGNSRPLLNAAADLFQLAGEVAFDANRYTDAAASYPLPRPSARTPEPSTSGPVPSCAMPMWTCPGTSTGRRHRFSQRRRGWPYGGTVFSPPVTGSPLSRPRRTPVWAT